MSEVTDPVRVLHVDDEPEFADLTAAFLEGESDRFSVETATSADEGLDRLAESEIDCIVSDYDMPGRDGIEFLADVRAEWPDLPFLLFTGKGSEDVASEAISAGATDYLQKEPGTDQYAVLANRIEDAVEHTRTQRERQRHLDAGGDRRSERRIGPGTSRRGGSDGRERSTDSARSSSPSESRSFCSRSRSPRPRVSS